MLVENGTRKSNRTESKLDGQEVSQLIVSAAEVCDEADDDGQSQKEARA